jgi:hypothetical protein
MDAFGEDIYLLALPGFGPQIWVIQPVGWSLYRPRNPGALHTYTMEIKNINDRKLKAALMLGNKV